MIEAHREREETGHDDVATELFSRLAAPTREALGRWASTMTAEDRAFMESAISRAVVIAHDRIIDARYASSPIRTSPGADLETEEGIVAEAVKMCRRP